MSSKRNPGSPAGDRVARATALIRALAGVVDATIEADGGDIRGIAVVADPALSAWEITRNVQSALLASLGLPIDMAIVEVRRPGALERQPQEDAEEPKSETPRGVAGKTNGNGKAARPNGNGHPGPAPVNGNSNGHAPVPTPFASEPATAEGAPARGRSGASIARLELESRPGGRIGCRVVVATCDRISAGEANGMDTPAGRMDAAARAVVAASPLAGVDLDAVRLLELAGRKYVIAAVRSWSGRELLYRAEVAPVEASPEAAAAQATLRAIMK